MGVNATKANIPNNAAPPDNIPYSRNLALKNSAPLFNCTLKINNQLIEDAQDLDIVNPMYNLLYYSKNFRKTTGSFWNYYPDKPKLDCHSFVKCKIHLNDVHVEDSDNLDIIMNM